ncbi:MAG: zinc ribbon domain-containing protein [Verrucomicrobiae bacterium]|nr:zinc ribbon domain-containing protein [Verrucomicrobiae bacterium]
MPIYEYEPVGPGPGCSTCGGGFTVRRSMSEPALTRCPDCGQPVRKIISAFSTPNSGTVDGAHAKAKANGFTVLKREKKGKYKIV